MVIVKIMGGLGNQMFQYAFARALSNKGKRVLLDCSGFLSQTNGDTIRAYELDKFNIKIDKASKNQIVPYYNKLQQFLYYIGRITGTKLSKIFMEKKHCYILELLDLDNKYFIGYWQTEKYFESIRNELLNELSFESSFNTCLLSEKNKELRKEILSEKNAVAVHVRGGDYNTPKNKSTYGNICTKEYYQKALEYIEKNTQEAAYYLFTNDVDFAKEIMPLNNQNIKIVDWNLGDDSWIDMYMMSICKHNIIANSSFSWWGAWLNQNIDKIVIAPAKWQNGEDIEDIVPDKWIRML